MIVVFPFLRVTGLRTKQGEFEQKEAKVTKGELGVGFAEDFRVIAVFPFLRVTGLRTKQGEFEQKEAKVSKGEMGVWLCGGSSRDRCVPVFAAHGLL